MSASRANHHGGAEGDWAMPGLGLPARVLVACLSCVLLAGCGTTGAGRVPGQLNDAFQSDTRDRYEITGTTDMGADEYGARGESDAANVYFLPGKGLYVEAKDNDNVVIARQVASMDSGSVILKFKPLVVYPAHGRITMTMTTTGAGSGYTMEVSGGNYEDALSKWIGASEVARHAGLGPYFTTLHSLGDYYGEMETSWTIPDPAEHTLELRFSPQGAEGLYDGQQVRRILDPAGAPVACDKVSIRFFQVECLLTGIEVRQDSGLKQ